MDRRPIPHLADYHIDRAGQVFARGWMPLPRDGAGRYRLITGDREMLVHARELLAVAYPEEPFPLDS